MPPELVTGLIGLAGVIIGSSGTLIAGIMTTRVQRFQAIEGRIERQNSVRRETYVSFITHTTAFLDLARELAASLDKGLTHEEMAMQHEEYIKEWKAVVRSSASVEISGPPEVATSAELLLGKIGALADVCDKWHAAQSTGRANARWQAFNEKLAQIGEPRKDFVSAAQNWPLEPQS